MNYFILITNQVVMCCYCKENVNVDRLSGKRAEVTINTS